MMVTRLSDTIILSTVPEISYPISAVRYKDCLAGTLRGEHHSFPQNESPSHILHRFSSPAGGSTGPINNLGQPAMQTITSRDTGLDVSRYKRRINFAIFFPARHYALPVYYILLLVQFL